MSFSNTSSDNEYHTTMSGEETTLPTTHFALQERPLRFQPARVYIESLARGSASVQ